MKERLFTALSAAWSAYVARAEAMRVSDRALALLAAALAGPGIIVLLLLPWQESSLKRARAQLQTLKIRTDRIAADQAEAERFERELADRAGELAKVEKLVVPSDAALRLLDEITTRVDKAGLDIRFTKKNARFDRAVERTAAAPGGAAPADPAAAVRYKVLPLEIACSAPTADALALVHILEGFAELNFGVRALTLSADGARASLALELEMVIEWKIPGGENG